MRQPMAIQNEKIRKHQSYAYPFQKTEIVISLNTYVKSNQNLNTLKEDILMTSMILF